MKPITLYGSDEDQMQLVQVLENLKSIKDIEDDQNEEIDEGDTREEIIANLLIVVCLCFLLCFALGVSVQQRKELKLFCRHDRVKDLSYFAMGKKCLSHLIDTGTSINKFNKTLFSFLLIINELE